MMERYHQLCIKQSNVLQASHERTKLKLEKEKKILRVSRKNEWPVVCTNSLLPGLSSGAFLLFLHQDLTRNIILHNIFKIFNILEICKVGLPLRNP